MNYTKGNWKVLKHPLNKGLFLVMQQGSTQQICNCYENEANARLIAEAPAMYEALKELRQLLKDDNSIRIQAHGIGDEFNAYRIFEKCDKVLAKVEGK